MGFKDARKEVLKALSEGTYQHEARNEIDVKNELATGAVSASDIAATIKRCNGKDHSMSKHHGDATIDVHVLRKDGWYIKFYFLEDDTWFISVHK